MTRRAGGDGARLDTASMPAVAVLRGFIGWRITDVTVRGTGIVVDLKLDGYTYNPPRRVLLKDLTRADTLPDPRPRKQDWEQMQIDIGDDMYERSRYDEHDIDIEPDRTATRTEEPR